MKYSQPSHQHELGAEYVHPEDRAEPLVKAPGETQWVPQDL